MSGKRLTSDDMLQKLKCLIPNLHDRGDIVSMDIQLRPNMFAVMQLRREILETDDLSKRPYGSPINHIEESLAVYNVNDFEDVMNKNNLMKDLLNRLLFSYDNREIDKLDELMVELRCLVDE